MDEKFYDFLFPSAEAARDFVERAAAEFPQDVSFFRSGHGVRVFNGTSASLYDALQRIYEAQRSSSPKMTRRVSETGVRAVRIATPSGEQS